MIGLILWGFLGAWNLTNQILIKSHPENISLTYQYLFDTDIHNATDALEQPFTQTELNEAPVTYGNLNQWFKLTLTNTIEKHSQLVLLLDNPMADNLEIYQHTDGKLTFIAQLGDTVELVSRDQRVLPSVDIELAANATTDYLIHFETQGAPYLPFVVITQLEFEDYQNTLHLIWGSFIGIVLLMSAYNLVLYFGVGDRTYFIYICYVITMLLLLGVVHGYGYYIFPEKIQLWLHKNIIAINSIAVYFTLQFSLYFLRFTLKDGYIFKLASYVTFAILGYAVFALFAPEYISAELFLFIQLIAYAVAFRLVFVKLKSRFTWTKYYIISWVPFFIGASIGYQLYSGQLSYSFITRHALMFSVIFEMAFISMALADRLGEIERKRLFQATHDFKLGFANESLLEDVIKRQSSYLINNRISLITIEISNYDAVIPYLNEEQLSQLMQGLGKYFSEQLSQSFNLIPIDIDSQDHPNVALVRGESFSYLIKTDNEYLIENTLKEISNRDNFNPIQEIVPYRIHCVFGAAVLKSYAEDPLDLIVCTKRAINLASDKGEPFHIYKPDSSEDNARKVRLAQDLGNAIQNNTLNLYHQPQVFFNDSSLCGSEVLLRWNHPELGSISPVEFVEIAEETGLIKRLTRWVIDQTFKQANQLIDSGQPHLNISINISASDLSRPSFFEDIESRLVDANLAAHLFTLEVTETSYLTDKSTFEQNLIKLKDIGFKFAIDDFGTGYSSLTYANDHPFSELKIDRSFVHDMLHSKKQLTIVSATITLAKEIGLYVTAEGVEDSQTLQSLRTLACDKAQGYFIAKPMPFEEYLKWHYQPEEKSAEVGETLSIHFNTEN